MSDLALSTFASSTGTHIVDRPRSARFEAFLDRFDEQTERNRLGRLGVCYLGRSERAFPPLLAVIHDPPAGLYLRGAGKATRLSRPAVAIVLVMAVVGVAALSSWLTPMRAPV